MSTFRTVHMLADRYRLDDQIAAGGMGEVWRATDLVLGRPVAVKLLRDEYVQHPDTLARFRAEARHAGSLSDPHIAQIYDYGEADAAHPPFLVMELVDGPPLTRLLAGGPLEPARAMDVVAQTADGLAAAHAAGLVHRDIKPGNLLLAPAGLVKITDFGIAYAAGSAPITRTGMLIGTAAYVAPERVAGSPATPASDLYSLGIVAYECLAGALPFSGTPMEVALAQQMRALPPLPAAVPAEAAALVAELTAKDPAARPASAGEVASRAGRLREALTGVPGAGPAGWPAPARAEGPGGWLAAPAAGPGAWPAPPPGEANAWPAPPPGEADTWAMSPPPRAEAGAASPPPPAADPLADTLVGAGETLHEIGTPYPPRSAQHRLVTRERARRPGVIALAVAAAAAVVALAAWALSGLSAGASGPRLPNGPASARSTPSTQPSTPAVRVNAAALTGQPVRIVAQRLRQLGLRVQVAFTRTDSRPPGTVVSVQPAGRLSAGSSVVVTAALPPHDQGHGHGHGKGGDGGGNGNGNGQGGD